MDLWAALIMGASPLWAGGSDQLLSLTGRLSSGMEAVAFANVQLSNLHDGEVLNGTASDFEGDFRLEVASGPYLFEVSAIGFLSFRDTLHLEKDLDLGTIVLGTTTFDLNTVVVSGSRRETTVAKSPVKVEVVSGKLLRDRGSVNLVDITQTVNGVEEVVGCGVCFTNSISVNGLPGAYTAILIDGAPIMGNLASVYGLNGIPSGMIEQVEILRGPHSTLYGSEALAGVINVITRSPETTPRLNLIANSDSHGESALDISGGWSKERSKGSWGTQIASVLGPVTDLNSDGFADHIRADRLSLYGRYQLGGNPDARNTGLLDVQMRLYGENRWNGSLDFMGHEDSWRLLRGNDSIYGESIMTRRAELFGGWNLPLAADVKFSFSASHHEQDSYYGADLYMAEQQVFWGDLAWTGQKLNWAGVHRLTAGLSYREIHYDDNTVATEISGDNAPNLQRIPGVYAQHDWNLSDDWNLVSGMRLDHYGNHGFIPAPRLALKYSPHPNTAIRINSGTGFRIVTLFTEDHAFVTGQRDVVIDEALNPERSWNLGFDARQNYSSGFGQGRLEAYGNYTRFSNKIIPNYKTAGQIVYANSNGHAVSAGGGLEWNHNFEAPLSLRLASQWQRVVEEEAGEHRAVEFAPDWSGIASIRYMLRKARLDFLLQSRLTGSMQLPEVYDVDESGNLLGTPRPDRSEAFLIADIQITHSIPSIDLTVRGGIRNLLNSVQSLPPVSGHDDPNYVPGFSPYFDTAYAYRPIEGRSFWIGIEWNLN